jgi:hypothetical protein
VRPAELLPAAASLSWLFHSSALTCATIITDVVASTTPLFGALHLSTHQSVPRVTGTPLLALGLKQATYHGRRARRGSSEATASLRVVSQRAGKRSTGWPVVETTKANAAAIGPTKLVHCVAGFVAWSGQVGWLRATCCRCGSTWQRILRADLSRPKTSASEYCAASSREGR